MKKVLYLLSKLNDDDIAWLTKVGLVEDLPNGKTFIHQGKTIDNLYIILEGTAKVEIQGIGEVATLSSGEIVGEVSFVDDRPPLASVSAKESLSVLAVPRDKMQQRLKSDDGFGSRFYHALAMFLSDRLRSQSQKNKPKSDIMGEDETIGELNLDRLDELANTGEKFLDILKTARKK